MTEKQLLKALAKAGELIATREHYCICNAMREITGDSDSWKELPQAKMIDPNSVIWWGLDTMGVFCYYTEARNARLLGIAMMFTMPDDMINEQFKTKK